MNRESLISMLLLTLLAVVVLGTLASHAAFASPDSQSQIVFPEDPEAAKFASAGLAFGLGALAAGLAVGRAGAAGMAATAERPEVRTTAIIITALGEALAIYGLVIALLIMGG